MIGLPLCSVSRRATSSACSISRSPSFQTSRPRSRADIWPHGPPSAARAAATAASTSAAVADATSAITSSVAGLTTGIVAPPAASRQSPPMSSCFFPSMVTCLPLGQRLASSDSPGRAWLTPVGARPALIFARHSPENLGVRFSRLAAMPSFASLALEQQLLQLALDRQALAEAGLGARLHGALDAPDRAGSPCAAA